MKEKLAIVMPTYNRADFLDYSFGAHLSMFQEFGIPVYVVDNASEDCTGFVVEKWQQEYSNLFYHKNAQNLGADRNFEIALKLPDAEYVWLLGDTYLIPRETLVLVLSSLSSSDFDGIVLNVGLEKKQISSQVYTDQNKLLEELFWSMTCLSALVYSKKMLDRANFPRYYNTYFIQTCVIFEAVSGLNFKIKWCADGEVIRLDKIPSGGIKNAWISNALKIWFESRVNAIFSLPPTYSLKAKIIAGFEGNSSAGPVRVKDWFFFKSIGVVDLKSFFEYKHVFKFVSNINMCVIFLIALLPRCVLNALRKVN